MAIIELPDLGLSDISTIAETSLIAYRRSREQEAG
jgi:hypothetical protein